MRFTRHFIVTAVVGVLLLVSFITAAQQERITLEVMIGNGFNPEANIVQDYGAVSWADILAQEFNKLYPHIDVVFRQGTLEQATVMIAAGMGPDIISGTATAFINLGRQDAFVDLNPLMSRDGIDYVADGAYWPPQWGTYSYEGRQFALPQYLGTIAIMYNASMFADMGIVDPSPHLHANNMDWDEFESIAKKLTRDTTGDQITDVWGFYKRTRTNRVYYWLLAAGAEFYGDEARTISKLNSPEAMAAMEYLRGLRWDSRVLPPADITPTWSQGQVAMVEAGSWELVNYLGLGSDGHPKVSFEWNVFPMPIGPSGQRATMGTIDGWAINKNTRHLEEAWALLQFLAGPTGNEIRAKYLAMQPAHRDVVPEYIGLMRELNRDVYDINVHVFTDAGPYAHPQQLYADPSAGASILNEAYSKILDNNQAVGTVWPEAMERLNRVLATTKQDAAKEAVVWQSQQWTTADFNTSLTGSATATGDMLAVSADGADIWGTRDGFRFVYQAIEGDFTATVRLDSVPDTHEWSKAGIMVRTADNAESPNVAVLGTLDKGITMQERLFPGSSSRTAHRDGSWQSGRPVYLRLRRQGNQVTGMYSVDGNSWTQLTKVDIALPERVLVGPAVTSHAPGLLGTATFTEWTVVKQ